MWTITVIGLVLVHSEISFETWKYKFRGARLYILVQLIFDHRLSPPPPPQKKKKKKVAHNATVSIYLSDFALPGLNILIHGNQDICLWCTLDWSHCLSLKKNHIVTWDISDAFSISSHLCSYWGTRPRENDRTLKLKHLRLGPHYYYTSLVKIRNLSPVFDESAKYQITYSSGNP